MADYRGIETISEALMQLLRATYDPADFDGNALQFDAYVADDFRQPMATGVSLFLYRVVPNGSYRTPRGRRDDQGRRFQSQLPLDLHYLLTVWARDASLQHRVAAWLMRLLEDTPILPHGLLESAAPGVFHPDETVEVLLGETSTEDLLHLWEALIEDGYQLSIPYVVRNVYIESRQRLAEGAPVHERVLQMRDADASLNPTP